MNFSQQQFEDLIPWLRQHHMNQADRIAAISGEKWQKYPFERLEDIPEDINVAHQKTRERHEAYRPHLEESKRLAGEAGRGFPQAVQEYMNPYQEQVTRRIGEEGMRNFREQMLPSLESEFVRAGQHGSSRHKEFAHRAARDVQNEIMGRQAQSRAAGYQQAGQLFNADMARRLEAAREHGNIGAATQAGLAGELAMLGEQGRYQQQQGQARKDLAFQEFLREHNYPKEQAAFASALYHGIPTPTVSTSYGQSPNAPQTNIAGNMGQLGGNIFGAVLAGRK